MIDMVPKAVMYTLVQWVVLFFSASYLDTNDIPVGSRRTQCSQNCSSRCIATMNWTTCWRRVTTPSVGGRSASKWLRVLAVPARLSARFNRGPDTGLRELRKTWLEGWICSGRRSSGLAASSFVTLQGTNPRISDYNSYLPSMSLRSMPWISFCGVVFRAIISGTCSGGPFCHYRAGFLGYYSVLCSVCHASRMEFHYTERLF